MSQPEDRDDPVEELPPDYELEDWSAPPERGVTMRHPALLIAVMACSIFLCVNYAWPRFALLHAARTPVDCGDIGARPDQRASDPSALPELPNGVYCTLHGIAADRARLGTGEAQETTDPYEKHRGRKFYLKLFGDKVFAVIAADRKAVVDYRLKKMSLIGYEISGVGRMIDPDRDARFKATASTLRLKYSIATDTPIRIFDATDQPGSPWIYAGILAALIFTALLAAYGLLRLVLRRREAEAPAPLPETS